MHTPLKMSSRSSVTESGQKLRRLFVPPEEEQISNGGNTNMSRIEYKVATANNSANISNANNAHGPPTRGKSHHHRPVVRYSNKENQPIGDHRRYQENTVEDSYDDDFIGDLQSRLNLNTGKQKQRQSSHASANETKDQLSDKFIIKRQLGNGGYALVYLGKDKNDNREYAIKQAETDKSDSQEKIESLQNEAKILSLLNEQRHKKNIGVGYIVELIQVIETPSTINLILEYCENDSLRHVYRTNGLGIIDESLAKFYMKQVIKGLLFIHENKIIHKDIKASNILLNSKDEIKICDFGISILAPHLTSEDQLIQTTADGSPYWMAPEIIKSQRICMKSDIWSVGALLLEILTGLPPFGKSNSQSASHSIGSGKPIELPIGKVSDECIDFMGLCFTFDHIRRPDTLGLLNHPWITNDESPRESKNNYDDDFEETEVEIHAKINNFQKFKSLQSEDVYQLIKDIIYPSNDVTDEILIKKTDELLEIHKYDKSLVFEVINSKMVYSVDYIQSLMTIRNLELDQIMVDFFRTRDTYNQLLEFAKLGGLTYLTQWHELIENVLDYNGDDDDASKDIMTIFFHSGGLFKAIKLLKPDEKENRIGIKVVRFYFELAQKKATPYIPLNLFMNNLFQLDKPLALNILIDYYYDMDVETKLPPGVLDKCIKYVFKNYSKSSVRIDKVSDLIYANCKSSRTNRSIFIESNKGICRLMDIYQEFHRLNAALVNLVHLICINSKEIPSNFANCQYDDFIYLVVNLLIDSSKSSKTKRNPQQVVIPMVNSLTKLIKNYRPNTLFYLNSRVNRDPEIFKDLYAITMKNHRDPRFIESICELIDTFEDEAQSRQFGLVVELNRKMSALKTLNDDDEHKPLDTLIDLLNRFKR